MNPILSLVLPQPSSVTPTELSEEKTRPLPSQTLRNHFYEIYQESPLGHIKVHALIDRLERK
jgi:hypothetical protein